MEAQPARGGAVDNGSRIRRAATVMAWLVAAFLVLGGAWHGGWAIVGLVALAVASLIAAMLWPALDARAGERPMAPLIALVGCDGSGKSTLSADMLQAFAAGDRPVLGGYLGLGSGALGERIKRWPLVGPALERRLARKATQARTKGEKIPGLATALVVYVFSLLRLRRFRRVLALRRAGIAVITDRYPQIEVPGFYDGPGLSAARPGSRAVALLARRERRIYDWMAGFLPDVVICLNIDADTAWARKPDHRIELMRQKVAATSRLRFNGARMVDVDASQPYAEVRAVVAPVVADALAAVPA